MSLEQLMDVEITSVSRRKQKASEAAAAVFVLTHADIRRSGVTTIPDALRLVPGVQVARLNAHQWAISVRGFNGRFANKLLVMIDGRSIYTPLFSGVFWDRHDVLMDEIERIEVIRGPGATLWGANAVNGVINIITRSSIDSQGTFVEATTGNVDKAIVSGRHGTTTGNTAYKVYGKGRQRAEGSTVTGGSGADDWTSGLAGFRSDTVAGPDEFMAEAQYQWSEVGEQASLAKLTSPYSDVKNLETETHGGFVLGRWSRDLGNDSSIRLQGYLDHRQFDDVRLSERRDTVDFEFQHNFRPAASHELIWGLGYRVSDDDIDNSFVVDFSPKHRTVQLFSGFVQDTFTLRPDELDLTLGTKIERNDYTGLELQPNARLLWQPVAHQTFWASVARAVRTPSRADNDVRLNPLVLAPGTGANPSVVPAIVAYLGDGGVKSEKLIAYELGYRTQPVEHFSFDLAVFYNDYSDLHSVSQGTSFVETNPSPTHVVSPFLLGNGMSAEAYGFEAVANWQMLPWWRWRGTYSLLEIDARVAPGLPESQARALEEASPEQQASLRAMIDLSDTVNLDAALRYVDQIETYGVEDYTALDLRLAWQPAPGMELSVVGRNLLDPTHPEFGSETLLPTQPTEAPRSFHLTFTAEF